MQLPTQEFTNTYKRIEKNIQEIYKNSQDNKQTFIYPISCVDLTLPEFGFTSTLFLQTSPWECLRVANNTWRPFIQCK